MSPSSEWVVYCLDIGVYHLGASGNPIARSKAAWVRLNRSPGDLREVRFRNICGASAIVSNDGNCFRAGRDLRALAALIDSDMEKGTPVAIGFEAPMWFPVHRHVPRQRFSMFKARFQQEEEREWYLQSGAAASLKAITLGVSLFSLLNNRGSISPTFSVTDWSSGGEDLLLFESFVTGEYKPPAVEAVPADVLDAMVGASALWIERGLIGDEQECQRPIRLHSEGGFEGEVISLWKMILDHAGCSTEGLTPADCAVYAMDWNTAGNTYEARRCQ